MTPHRFFRVCGLLGAAGAAALLLFALFHPERDVALALEPAWVWEHQPGVLAFILIPFGLIGVYGVQIRQTGLPGLTAFIVALAGSVLYAAGVFMDAYFFPLLAEQAPLVVEDVLRATLSGAPLVGLGMASVAFTFGLMLLGFVTLRAAVLPRVAAVLLVVGAPLFGPGSALPKPLQVGGAVALGAAIIWLGYAAWQTPETA